MKISKKMQDALNEQINKELSSAYIYLSMSSFFEGKNWAGMANWMKQQANEEVAHAMKIFGFVFERGGDVKLSAIKAPPTTFKSELDAFETAYKHEMFITDSIHKLVDLSVKEKDKATETMLQWFVTEQVEEEDNALGIVEKLKMIKGAPGGLYMLDKELGARGK